MQVKVDDMCCVSPDPFSFAPEQHCSHLRYFFFCVEIVAVLSFLCLLSNWPCITLLVWVSLISWVIISSSVFLLIIVFLLIFSLILSRLRDLTLLLLDLKSLYLRRWRRSLLLCNFFLGGWELHILLLWWCNRQFMRSHFSN